MNNTFKRPQKPSNSFDGGFTPTPTFKPVEADQVAPGTTWDADYLQSVVQAVTVNTEFQSSIAEMVRYSINSRLDMTGPIPCFILNIEFTYPAIHVSMRVTSVTRHTSMRTRGKEERINFTCKAELLFAVRKLIKDSDILVTEPVEWLAGHLHQEFFGPKDLSGLLEKHRELKGKAKFDFTGNSELQAQTIEDELLKKKEVVKVNKNKKGGLIEYIKTHKALTVGDFILGTFTWFTVFYALGGKPLGFMSCSEGYLDFMFMQHLYAIPFFWLTGIGLRLGIEHHLNKRHGDIHPQILKLKRHYKK